MGVIDADIRDMLEYLDGNGYLKNTLVIVMGDHGLRIGATRITYQGHLEERLPMMSLAFPEQFQVEIL